MFSLLKYLVGVDILIIMHGLALFGFNAKHLRYSTSWHKANLALFTFRIVYTVAVFYLYGWRFRDCCKALSRVKTTITDLKLTFNNSAYTLHILFIYTFYIYSSYTLYIYFIYSSYTLHILFIYYSYTLQVCI